MATQEQQMVVDRRTARRSVVDAAPERIYDLVADLPRMGEWSPECQRGRVGGRGQRSGRGGHVRRPQPGRARAAS